MARNKYSLFYVMLKKWSEAHGMGTDPFGQLMAKKIIYKDLGVTSLREINDSQYNLLCKYLRYTLVVENSEELKKYISDYKTSIYEQRTTDSNN